MNSLSAFCNVTTILLFLSVYKRNKIKSDEIYIEQDVPFCITNNITTYFYTVRGTQCRTRVTN